MRKTNPNQEEWFGYKEGTARTAYRPRHALIDISKFVHDFNTLNDTY